MKLKTAKDAVYARITCSIAVVMMAILLMQCKSSTEDKSNVQSIINTAHLDALYEEKRVGDDTVGIIHIYSEYPDYHHVGDEDEGIACVDDASRAAIFYLRQYAHTSEPEHLHKARMVLKFLLAMQAPNGYYYNFIWLDGSIHREGITTAAEPNFWSWRALWAFGEAIHHLDSSDPLVNKMKQQREKVVGNILAEKSFRSVETDTAMGWTFPMWLPKVSGTDQAAIVLLGLTWMLEQSSDQDTRRQDSIISFMEWFAEGIISMQVESPDSLHDGAFLSWENLWHAYANIQAYALLTAGQALDDPHMIAHGLYEVDRFYPSILQADGLEHFQVRVVNGKIIRYDTKAFSQIAYGRRPMIWAAIKAFEITKEDKYLALAKELGEWFSGQNPAQLPMYDPATGRGYDGISGPGDINKNAGAESTIEALLSLQSLEKYMNN
jgi:hypothetical protein